MSDQEQQPSEEEIEAYYAQLREAPIGELLMQCVGMLAAGAEAKLGRPDARPLIDGMAALVQLGGSAFGESTEQLTQAVAQLQMAQVQVERQMAAQAGGTPADGSAAAAPQAGPAAQAPAAPTPPQPNPVDKLWIPGR